MYKQGLNMKLTPAIIKNLYSAIYCMKPFDRWPMPLPEQIKFVIDSDPEKKAYSSECLQAP